MSNRGLFNFRDVLRRLGLDVDDKRINWAVGHMLRDAAVKRGVPIHRPLTEKTDPNAKVPAKHCIAAYPMSFLPEAMEIVKDRLGQSDAQKDLFE